MNPLLSALVAANLMPPDDAARIDRQLDSNVARAHAEAEMLRAFQVGLSGQRDRLVDAVRATDGLFPLSQQNRLWAGENERLWASVRGTLLDVASERAVLATASAGDVSMWALVNEAVIEKAEGYYLSSAADSFGSIPNLNVTSRTMFSNAFAEWQRGELQRNGLDGLPELIRAIEPAFGKARAAKIGVTETTRLFTMSELAAGEANEFIVGWLYNTVNDAFVSDLCRPAHGTVMLKGKTTFPDGLGSPPRHVLCRSFITAITQGAMDTLRAEGLVTPAPVPVAPPIDYATASIDDMTTVEDVSRWATARYPHINFDFTDTHIDTIKPTTRQFDVLARKYPEVAARLEYVGTYKGPNPPAFAPAFNTNIAHAQRSGKVIGLNPMYYNDPVLFAKTEHDSFTSNWTDADGSIEGTMTHEFGHQVENWLVRTQKNFLPHATSDGFGTVSGTVNMFNDKYKPTASLSKYAITTNSVKTAPSYEAAASKVEGWAEAFSAIHHKPRKEWPIYVKRIDALLTEVAQPSKWSEIEFVDQLPLGERAAARDLVNEVRKRLGL